MKRLLLLLLLTRYFYVTAQPIITENSVLIKPYFNLGESKVYKIKMEAKTEDPPFVFSRAQQEYEVTFTAVDTAGGYTLLYKCRTIKATDKKWIGESLAAQVSNNIEVVYKVSKNGKFIAYENIQKVQKQLVNALDSKRT